MTECRCPRHCGDPRPWGSPPPPAVETATEQYWCDDCGGSYLVRVRGEPRRPENIVTIVDIAARLGIPANTVRGWVHKDHHGGFPAASHKVVKASAWEWPVVQRWLTERQLPVRGRR